MDGNIIGSLIISMLSHPTSVPITAHGARALEWIVAAGGALAAKVLIDEGVFAVVRDVLSDHVDADAVRYSCSMVAKTIRLNST